MSDEKITLEGILERVRKAGVSRCLVEECAVVINVHVPTTIRECCLSHLARTFEPLRSVNGATIAISADMPAWQCLFKRFQIKPLRIRTNKERVMRIRELHIKEGYNPAPNGPRPTPPQAPPARLIREGAHCPLGGKPSDHKPAAWPDPPPVEGA